MRHWGKQPGKDFMEGKATLPLIRAYKAAGDKERAQLKELFSPSRRKHQDYLKALKIIHQHRGVEYTGEKARQHTAAARKNLSIFPDSPYKKALDAMADFVVNRKY